MILNGDILTELIEKGEVSIYHNKEEITNNKNLNLPLNSNFYSISLQCGVKLASMQTYNPLVVLCIHNKDKKIPTDVYTIQFKSNNFIGVFDLLPMLNDDFNTNITPLVKLRMIYELMMTGDIRIPTGKNNPYYTQNTLWYEKRPNLESYYRIGEYVDNPHKVTKQDMEIKTLEQLIKKIHERYVEECEWRTGKILYSDTEFKPI